VRAHLPLAAACAVTGAAGLVFTRALHTRTNYDEGVYLASLGALRRGQALGADVYTSQPPIFYWVLRLVAAPFGDSVAGIRVGFALLGVVGVAAAIVLGSRVGGLWAGVVAGALLAIAPPYPTVSPTVSADVPAVVLGLCALAVLALGLRPARGRAWAAAGGALLAAAILTKLLALPFVVPFAALALAGRAGRRLLLPATVGAAAVAALVALVHLRALPDIWAGVIGDHTGASELGSVAENARWIRDFLVPRTPIAWLAPAGLLAFALSRPARAVWPLWTLTPAAWLFLLAVRPLADHHFVLLSVAYAIGAGPSLALALAGLPRQGLRALSACCVALFVAAGLYQEQRRLGRNEVPEPPAIVWATREIERSTSPDAVVVSDQPIVVFRAGRRTPGLFVDTSNTRITGGGLTPSEILAGIDRARPEAVVAARMLRTLPSVLTGLDARFPTSVTCGEATLYLRSGARPACTTP
jgi:4-amino-4-deoxy-L-arabinose transferase-like glycosyltransferase